MAETARDSANPPTAPMLSTSVAGRRSIRHRSSEPPDRANWIVTISHLPFAALKWLGVGVGVVTMLLIAPVVDLVGGSLLRLGRLLWRSPASRR